MNADKIISSGLYDAFIFDMDGLLLDTEKICWECFKNACGYYNYDPDFSIYKRCIGRKAEEGNKLLNEGFGNNIPFEEVQKKWSVLYGSYIENEVIPVKDGVYEFLNFLAKKNIRKAVATSTASDTALKKLKKSGLVDFFELIVSGDQVNNSKPHPEIYIKTAQLLNIVPQNCIAFEDSDNGAKSAFSAGMTVVQVVDMVEPSVEVKKLNHLIVNSFNELLIK